MSEKSLSIYKEPVRLRNTACMLEVLLQNFSINGEHKMPEVGSEPNSLEKLDSAISPSAVQLGINCRPCDGIANICNLA